MLPFFVIKVCVNDVNSLNPFVICGWSFFIVLIRLFINELLCLKGKTVLITVPILLRKQSLEQSSRGSCGTEDTTYRSNLPYFCAFSKAQFLAGS